MARIATLSSLKKKEESKVTGQAMFAGGGGQGGSNTAVFSRDTGDKDLDRVFSKGSDADAGAPSVSIEVFRNGFRLNGGEFRPTVGPDTTDANRLFLRSIARREVPRELEPAGGGSVDLAVTDRRDVDFDPSEHAGPAPAPDRFAGAGQSLGGGAAAAPASASATASTAAAAGPAPAVDDSLPTVTVAVRLVTGRRQRVVLNETHTVGDLTAAVAALGATGGRPFQLLSGFPPLPLGDMGATLVAAGLKGAAVTQKAV